VRIREIKYNDEGEPETLTFSMTLGEAGAIFTVFGGFNRYALARLGASGPEDDIYGGIAQVFNGHWEDGRPPGLIHKPDLSRLNVATVGE
jgi:hypothetical protein